MVWTFASFWKTDSTCCISGYDKPKDACKTIVYLAVSEDVSEISGELFEKVDLKMVYPPRVLDKTMTQNLMNDSEEIIRAYIQ